MYNSRKQEKVTLRKLIGIITKIKVIQKEKARKGDKNIKLYKRNWQNI